MDFTLFKKKVEILNEQRSNELRDRYICKFVNVDDKLYQERIQLRHKFIDGYCYLGYLWEYIINSVVIEEEYISKKAVRLNNIYVFWDIHSCEKILIKDYWKFDKDVVLKMNIKTLLLGDNYLPEDIYIFDESFSWTLIKTHEYISGKRFCLKFGNI